MKWKFVLFSLLIFSPLVGHAGNLNVEPGTWWEVQLNITINGSYRYNFNDTAAGEYVFKIKSTASIEQDYSGDYILYPESEQVSVVDWKEKRREKENGTISTSTDFSKIMSPSLRINYVIKKEGELYFDFDIFLKNEIFNSPHPLKQLLLPCSALNHEINPKNKYNRDVRKGSNEIKIAEELFLNQLETIKSFGWEWQRDNPELFNSHSVVLELRIIKKSPRE